jgi:hypothetical protein
MDWKEINIVIEALEALIEKYSSEIASGNSNADKVSDLVNDRAYARILVANYKTARDSMHQ